MINKVGFIGILLLVISVMVTVYYYSGARHFVRVITHINNIKSESAKHRAQEIFNNAGDGYYSGILAWVMMGKVGVWGNKGLKFYTTDQYSVYHYTDGCSDKAKTNLTAGKYGFEEKIYPKMSDWQKRLQIGDYITVKTTQPANGGTLGNLREVFARNYWSFFEGNNKTQCAK